MATKKPPQKDKPRTFKRPVTLIDFDNDIKSESSEKPSVETREAECKIPSLAKPQSIVTIHVGKSTSKQTFYCHKAFLCHYSPFFKKAFDINSHFKEGETQIMTLEDDEPDIFGLFFYWTLYQNLNADGTQASTLILSKLWILADKFLCPKLQNIVIAELGGKKRDLFVRRCMDLILKNTSRGSQLYTFLIHNMATLWAEEGQIEKWEGLSSENFFDLLKEIRYFVENGEVVKEIDEYYVLE